MAARFRAEDGELNAGSSDNRTSIVPAQLVLRRCGEEGAEVAKDEVTQSRMDQSILAIFEDSGFTSEDKSGSDEDSETLLSALADMLDSVGNEGGALSPFDTLPDTKLLTHPESRNNSAEPTLAERLRPRLKSPNSKSTFKINVKKMEQSGSPRCVKQHKVLFPCKNKKAEAEVELFTSTSLANLVKIMHPYCLRLRVEEEGGKPRRKNMFFSQEEVWKYERPNEELDEEINVVSDDEVSVKETKDVDRGDVESDNGQLLKSVLLSGKSSRGSFLEKKRVSFGSVQVASFEVTAEQGLKFTTETVLAPPNTKTAPECSADLLLELSSNQAEVRPLKDETKTKSLSLQQYRQLCQKRQPLVEKRGNYMTKWPSVSEPPKGLTPIFDLQGQRPDICESKSQCLYSDSRRSGADQLRRTQTSGSVAKSISSLPGPHPSQARTSVDHGELKHRRTESNIASLAYYLPGVSADVSESKKHAAKRPKLLSSDPPNPVLIPLSVSGTSPQADHCLSMSKIEFPDGYFNFNDTGHFQEKPSRFSGTSLQRQSSSFGPEHKVLPLNQDVKSSFLVMASGTSCQSNVMPGKPSSEGQEKQPHKSFSILTKEIKLGKNTPPSPSPLEAPVTVKEEGRPTPESDCVTANTGIQALDLTSLLEQFEETEAKNNRADPLVKTLESSRPLNSPAPPQTCSDSLVDIPEPFGSEVVIRAHLLARHKHPASKAVQIIDPRPLRSRKTCSDHSESSPALTGPHVYSSMSSDHEYCRHVDGSSTDAAHHEPQVTADASECKQTSTAEGDATVIIAVNHSAKSDMDGIPPPSDSTSSDRLHSPPPSSLIRGRERSRYRRRAPYSDSSSSSSSPSSSPKRQMQCHQHSESSSCSSTPSGSISRSPSPEHTWSYSGLRCSRFRSLSRSRSRSRSPPRRLHSRQWKEVYRRGSSRLQNQREIRKRKLKAIEERRVVYVGGICGSMTHAGLRERFSEFGEVECVSLHFRERGHHYGFVTFSNMKDAFTAVSKGSKLRRPDELPFDLCFGGRRHFCYSDYTDLDAIRDADSSPTKSKFEELDFDQLLKQAQRGMKR